MNSFIKFLIVTCCLNMVSCKKYLDVGSPDTQLTSATVFSSDATATAAMIAVYAGMEATGLQHDLLINTGIAGDEAINYFFSPDMAAIAMNDIVPSNAVISAVWSNWYKYIYQSNAVLKGVDGSGSLSEVAKKQLKGEALFMRAFLHFHLANLFGDIPYITTTEYTSNAIAARDPVASVLQKITDDLLQAKDLLASQYVSAANISSSERVRPNKYAAAAMLARVYLFRNEWSKAEAEAGFVIENTSMYSLSSSLTEVFLKNSNEAILQWMATLPGYNSYTGGSLVPSVNPVSITLRQELISAFESGDLRKEIWTKSITNGSDTYVYPFKYQVGQSAPSITEYTMVLRLAELYLIRAEARLKQNNLSGSTADINTIRTRAGLAATTAATTDQLMNAIRQERRMELFTEFGDRWFDMKRTGIIDQVMTSLKPASWTATDELFPIPQTEIDRNPHLTQNRGY
ncbi:MAG: RagB/SusD family nutrient uptake outer membrane protein [Chitinophagaceae bacterium]